MSQPSSPPALPPGRKGGTRVGFLVPILAALVLVPQAARAQEGASCQTIAADVQQEQPTGLPTVSGQGQYSLEGRTSEQLIQQWATIQDPDPDACRVMREVERRLAVEDEFARQQCPDVLPGVRSQAALARSEAGILCKGRN